MRILFCLILSIIFLSIRAQTDYFNKYKPLADSLSEKYENYAKKVLNLLEIHEIRAVIDNRNETIGKKIRDSELKKVPFMLVVGEKEAENNEVSVRQRNEGDLGSMTLELFDQLIQKAIENELSVNA